MDESINVNQLKKRLNLQPLSQEGGFYCETYRSNIELPLESLPDSHQGTRSLSTAIFYLLTPETHSAIHKLPGDEVYHFYLGDPVELLQLYPDGSSQITVLGQQVFDGMKLQEVVPGGTFQGARLKGAGNYALLGTTMAPGFEFEDYVPGNRENLVARYPSCTEMIDDLI